MNTEQTYKLFLMMKAEKPHSFQSLDKKLFELKIELWADEFKNDSYETVFAAVRYFLVTDTQNFAPGIGQIREIIYKNSENGKNVITSEEAWNNIVLKALKNSYYKSETEFKKLPKNIQKIVGSPANLKTWSIMDTSSLEKNVKYGFAQSYSIMLERDRDSSKISPQIKKILETGNKNKLNAPEVDEVDFSKAFKRF